MRYSRFLAFELVAAFLWTLIYCFVGYFVGMHIDQLQLLFERSGWVILGILVLLFLAWRFFGQRMRYRLRRSRGQQRTTSHPTTSIGKVESVRE